MATAALASGLCLESTITNAHFSTGPSNSSTSQRSYVSVTPASSSFLGLRAGHFRVPAPSNARDFAMRVVAEGAAGVRESAAKGSVVVIDNYDSFTYNLVQYLGDLGCEIEVFRNDEITVEELRAKKPRGILISPGPGTPQDSGISLEIVRKLGPSIPLFGVCMGLQCMGEAFGGKIVRAPNGVMHGKTSPVYHDEKGEPGLLDGLPRYFCHFSSANPYTLQHITAHFNFQLAICSCESRRWP